jgi:hypothetical protein
MLESCYKHNHEKAAALCGRCGLEWCSDCIVYPFGPKKSPYCMSCAMVAGGVRTSGALPAMPRKELKARMKAAKLALAGSPQAPAVPEAPSEIDLGPDPEPELAEANHATDWATPWWEDRQPTLAD